MDPKNTHNNIRYMKANPNSSNPAQRVDYVKYTKNGWAYDVNGLQLLNGKGAESHIPQSQFNYSIMPKF
jgi:hypothetical protein